MGRNGANEAVWRRRIGRQRRSGMSVQRFCQIESVSTASFYAWKRRLQQSASRPRAGSPSVRPTTADCAESASSTATFLPVRVLPDGAAAGASGEVALALEFSDGLRVEVRAGCDQGLLREVLEWRRPTETPRC
jgi:hypothetical protein